jgi:hypothetical protein
MKDLSVCGLARRSQVIPNAIGISSVELVANGVSPYQDGVSVNAELTFVEDPECNSRPFGFSSIATSMIPGLITLADRLTCVVGKNQSGKTNLLKALQKFNPVEKTVKYGVRSDWPRGGRRAKDETQVVCEAHFDLDAELDELAGLTDSAVQIPKKVVVSRNYAGQYAVDFPEHPDFFASRAHRNDVDQICAKMAVPSTAVGEAFLRASGECVADAKQTAHQGQFVELAKLAEPHRERLERAGSSDQLQSQNEAQFVLGYVSLLGQISNELAALPTVRRKADECIIRHLPIYLHG